jgi:hypothetical protein
MFRRYISGAQPTVPENGTPMTPEEMNTAIEFLIKHAANFSVQMDELRTQQREFSRQQEKDHKIVMELTESVSKLAQIAATQSRRLDRLEQSSPNE